MRALGRSTMVVHLFAVGVLVVAACGGDDTAEPTTTPTAAETATTPPATAPPEPEPEPEPTATDPPALEMTTTTTTTTTTTPVATNDDDDDDEETGPAGARVLLEMSGEGYTANYDAWNCHGIEGEWNIGGELIIEGYGTIRGGGTFVFPPRPVDGTWDSEPFSYSMEGTLDMGDAVTDILYEFEDVVFTIIELENGPTLGDSSGTAKGTVRVTTPEMSMVVSETYTPFSLAQSLIRSETHPSCVD